MADPENTARQIEEIEALTSIYENCVQIENEHSYSGLFLILCGDIRM